MKKHPRKCQQKEETTMNNFKLILVLLALTSGIKVFAQEKDVLGTENLNVFQDYQPTITNAQKISDNPNFNASVPEPPDLKYAVLNKQYGINFLPDTIKPASIKGEPLTKLYSSLIKVGLGNYKTPYGEYFYNNQRDKLYNYGFHAKHLSSSGNINDLGYPGISENILEANGKYQFEKYTLSGNTFYKRDAVHFYGYDKDYKASNQPLYPILLNYPDTILTAKNTFQRFANWGANANLKSILKDSAELQQDIKLSYYSIYDYYNAGEHNINANAELGKFYMDHYIHGNVGLDFYNNFNSIVKSNNALLFTLNPKALFKGAKWFIDLGANITVFNEKSTTYYFYPDITANYNLAERFVIFYAQINGKNYRNSFKAITNENPFVTSVVPIKNTNLKYNISGGFKGQLSSYLSYNTGVNYKILNNAMYFVNYENNLIQNRFTAVYDDLNIFNINGEVLFNKNEKYLLSAKANYYMYDPKNELKAWNKPNFDATLSARYNLESKIIARLDLFYIGQRYGRVTAYDSTSAAYKIKSVTLKGIVDVNLGFEYRYTKRLSGFISFNNIAAMRYYRWNNYPSQKFNFLVGLTYAF